MTDQLSLFAGAALAAPFLATAECARCHGQGAYYDGMANGGEFALTCDCGAPVNERRGFRFAPEPPCRFRLRAASHLGVELACALAAGKEYGLFYRDRSDDAPPSPSPSDELAARYAALKAELRIGAPHGRFRTPITNLEFRDGPRDLDEPAPNWWQNPAKVKGMSAEFVGRAGSVYIACDMSKPDLSLDRETLEAWSAYAGLPVPDGTSPEYPPDIHGVS